MTKHSENVPGSEKNRYDNEALMISLRPIRTYNGSGYLRTFRMNIPLGADCCRCRQLRRPYLLAAVSQRGISSERIRNAKNDELGAIIPDCDCIGQLLNCTKEKQR
jgi:hypothetical protein